MIEALACGTPATARPCDSLARGSVRWGDRGLVATEARDLVKTVNEVDKLARQVCREEFKRRLTAEVMTANYECLYSELSAVRLNGVEAEGGVVEGKMRACATTRY